MWCWAQELSASGSPFAWPAQQGQQLSSQDDRLLSAGLSREASAASPGLPVPGSAIYLLLLCGIALQRPNASCRSGQQLSSWKLVQAK